jgi:hypothetical protein
MLQEEYRSVFGMFTILWIRVRIGSLDFMQSGVQMRIDWAISQKGLSLVNRDGYAVIPKELQPLFDRLHALSRRKHHLIDQLRGK